MWSVVLSLAAALTVGFLVGGGPMLWLSLCVGLAVFGGDPSDPIAAVVAVAFLLLRALRSLIADRLGR